MYIIIPQWVHEMKQRLHSILLIDDDPANNFLMEIFLREEMNYAGSCTSLNSMQEGLDHLRSLTTEQKQFPGLILLDVNMPGRGGFDLLNAIQREGLIQNQPTRVILFSALVHEALQEQGRNYPEVIEVVEKDFSNKHLRTVIEAHFTINA